MEKERICYYCKKCENHGLYCPEFYCTDKELRVECYDYCQNWEDYEQTKD